MSQDIFSTIIPTSTSGNQLAALLNSFRDALMSGLSGTSRPSALLAGGTWVDVTRAALGFWDLKIYTGTQDVTLFAVNLNTGAVSIAATENQFDVVMRTDNSYGPVINLLKKRIANGGQTLSGDTLGELQWSGLTDASLAELQARIKVVATENVTATTQGSEMVFSTTQKGSTNLRDRMKITDEGKVGIGMVPTVEFEVSGAIKGTNVYGGNGTFTGTVSGVNGTFTGTVGILNLNVTGVFNAAETHLGAITEITDPNFVLNKGGNQADANANTAGFTVEMTNATHFKMGYDSTKASKVVAGPVGALKELLNVDSAQQAKNKSIETPSRLDAKVGTKANLVTYAALAGSTSGQLCYASDEKRYYGLIDKLLAPLGVRGGQATNMNKIVVSNGTTAEIEALDREAGSVYFDSEQQKMVVDDGTFITPVGGGSGSPSIFGLLQSDGDTLTWFTGNNATFLGAGAITGSFTKQATDVILSGRFSYKFVLGNVNDYVCSGDVFVPVRHRGNTINVNLPYIYNGNEGGVRVVFYDTTASALLPLETKFLKNTNGVAGTFSATFNVPSTCQNMRVGFHNVVANSGKILTFDDIVFDGDAFKFGQVVEQEYIGYSGWTSGNNPIVFTTKDTKSTDRNILQGTASRLTIKKSCYGSVTVSYQGATGALVGLTHYNSSGSAKWNSGDATSTGYGTTQRTGYFEAGDYFEASSSASPQNYTGTNISAICSSISDNVIQSWQDGTEWTSYTPTFSGLGTVTTSEFKWKKEGSDLLIYGKFNISTDASASEARIGLPNGLTSASTANNVNSAGTMWGSYVSASMFALSPLWESQKNYLTIGRVTGTTNGITKINGNALPSNEQFIISARIPIAGWSSTPTLLALPTSQENVYRLTVNPYTNTITSDPNSTVSSISQSGGIVTINLKSGVLTATPTVVSNYRWVGNNDIYSRVENASTSSITIALLNAGIYRVPTNDALLDVVIAKGSDYKAPGVFVGNVAKNQVAIVQYRGNGTRTTITSSGVAMPLSVVKGNSSIVSISSNQFTLQAGEYDIECSPWIYLGNNFAGGAVYNFLYNITDAQEVERGQPVENATGAGVLTSFHPKLVTTVTITSAKAFEYRIQGSSGVAAAFIGDSLASPNDLHGQIKITKLNGQ